jgi:hypothetical protein
MRLRFHPHSLPTTPSSCCMYTMPRATPNHRPLSTDILLDETHSSGNVTRYTPRAPHHTALLGQTSVLYESSRRDSASLSAASAKYVLVFAPLLCTTFDFAPHSTCREDWSPTSSRTSVDGDSSPTLSHGLTHITYTTETASYSWPRFQPLTDRNAASVPVIYVEYRASPPSPALSSASLESAPPLNFSYVRTISQMSW